MKNNYKNRNKINKVNKIKITEKMLHLAIIYGLFININSLLFIY